MQAFIGAGFDINAKGCVGRTILHEALRGGVQMVTYLLQEAGGEKLVNTGDDFYHTPLHFVACSFLVRYERRILTKLLLQHGADIQASDIYGNTPANIAARVGDVDTMRVLIAAGIDFLARGSFGSTILHDAVHNRKGMLEYLLRQGRMRKIIYVEDVSGNTPLDLAVLPRARKALKRVVELGDNTKA